MKILSDPKMLNEHKFIINKKNETIIKAIKEIESFKGQLAKETEKKESFESTITQLTCLPFSVENWMALT